MRLREEYITHETDGEQILIDTSAKFCGMVRSNKTAAFIVDCLQTETTREAIIAKMLEKYDASEEIISRDVDMVLEKLQSIGAICE